VLLKNERKFVFEETWVRNVTQLFHLETVWNSCASNRRTEFNPSWTSTTRPSWSYKMLFLVNLRISALLKKSSLLDF